MDGMNYDNLLERLRMLDEEAYKDFLHDYCEYREKYRK